jgi:lipopolysaccharide/colanic/teichoic acid biosynthesis glycosyltransferase
MDGLATARAAKAGGPLADALRRALDVSLACTLLLLLAPLLTMIGLAIRLESPGPALFRQRRVGRWKREFTALKFRSMRSGADCAPHREYVHKLIRGDAGARVGTDGRALFKLAFDDRVTAVGGFIRRWSFDELPQLWNVVRGEMSLVGPRPVLGYELEHYPPSWNRRFDVKPGLTGLWQVSGRSQRSYEEMVGFDVEYAERQALLLDLRILAKTVRVVLGRRGVA